MANAIKPIDWKAVMGTAKKNAKVQQLEAQMSGTRARLAAQGHPVGNVAGHPSILGRILDVVSRPNYAVANTFDSVVKAINANKAQGKGGDISKLPGILAGGALRGIEGKDKTRFSNVLADMGQKNRVVRGLGGFAADVTTDPLSFVGGSITHAAPEIEGVAAGGRAIKAAQAAGVETPDLMQAAEAANNATKLAKPGSIGLEILGRPVAESEKLYSGLAKVGRPLKESALGDWANKSFRTAARFPGELKKSLTVNRQASIAGYNDLHSAIMDNLGSLTREEGARVAHAIEKGVDLSGVTGKKGMDLGKAQEYWRGIKEHFETVEKAHGLTPLGAGLDNFVPHKFATSAEYNSDTAKAFRDLQYKYTNAANGAKGFPKGALPTLEDLKDAGLHPHENIVDIAQIRAADHGRAIARTAFHHDLIDTVGSEFTGKGAKAASEAAHQSGLVKLSVKDVPTLGSRNVWVPEQARNAIRTLNKFYLSDEETGKFTKTFDEIQRLWKTGVTTVNPGHHVRNMIGDAFLNWEAGVQGPGDYSRGLRVLRGSGTVKIGEKSWDAAEIKRLFNEHGANSGFYNTDLVGATTPGAFTEHLTEPANSSMEWLRNKVATRENWFRMTNFVHSMREQAAGKAINTFADLNEVASKAAEHVRKFNFDYSDLTPFESKLRRLVPFYTFMRKNMPLQLEMLMLHPGKISQVPKGFAAIQQLLGTDPQHLPVTEHIPAYMKDVFNLRLRGETGGHNALYAGVPLPLEDLSRTFTGSTSDVIRKMVGQTTIPARAAYELGSKTSATSGAPLHGGIGQYAVNQIPISRLVSQLVHPPTPNRVIQPGEQTTQKPLVDVGNYLFGQSVREITPQMQLSELRRQQTPLQAQLRSLRTQRVNAALRRKK